MPLQEQVIREWAGYKFCTGCWNYLHSHCNGKECQCGCKGIGKAKLREIAETLDILEYDYSLGVGEQVDALYAKAKDNHAN